jgi:hypothetical protein
MERTPADLADQRDQLAAWGMKILPHAWPGFSWTNLKRYEPGHGTPRAGGDFYWERLYNAVNLGADQVFLGMFDEYDEGTAIMPMSDNHPLPHTEWGSYIDNEGLDPFWYLQLSGAARDMLNGLRPLSSSMPGQLTVAPGACGGDDATVHLGTADRTSGLDHPQPADGLTTGAFIEGHDCRTNQGGGYFYFDIDDAFCFARSSGQAATVKIEFFDAYPGSSFRLQYDAVGGEFSDRYTQHPVTIAPPGTGGWKIVRWEIDDGFFGNRQNGGSDFRLFIGVGNQAAVRRVSLFLPEEAGGDVVAEAAPLRLERGVLKWPAAADAVGWRPAEADSLGASTWQDLPGPFTYTNGTVHHPATGAGAAAFYRLERSPRP